MPSPGDSNSCWACGATDQIRLLFPYSLEYIMYICKRARRLRASHFWKCCDTPGPELGLLEAAHSL